MMLETRELTKQFGGFTAVDHVSMGFPEDELVAIIGPNGAGKTTFFNLVTGSLQPTSGELHFRDTEITNKTSEEIANLGLARSYQTSTLFEDLSAFRNVRVATLSNYNHYNFWRDTKDHIEANESADAVLDRVGLAHKRDVLAKNLSHGDRRRLEIAVALATEPHMLLMDEPTSGMSPEETQEVIELVSELATDIPIAIVEHKMSVVMAVADRIIVLHDGQKLAEGTPEEVKQNRHVREVYLGT